MKSTHPTPPLSNACNGPRAKTPGMLRWGLLFALAGLGQWSTAADVAAGKAKAATVCQTCHGLDGRGTLAMVANIGGQQKQYLVKQLSDYRSGKRQHEQMSIIAQMLSDEDIENLAEWYSRIIATFEIPE
jgi:cytochrome c553